MDLHIFLWTFHQDPKIKVGNILELGTVIWLDVDMSVVVEWHTYIALIRSPTFQTDVCTLLSSSCACWISSDKRQCYQQSQSQWWFLDRPVYFFSSTDGILGLPLCHLLLFLKHNLELSQTSKEQVWNLIILIFEKSCYNSTLVVELFMICGHWHNFELTQTNKFLSV